RLSWNWDKDGGDNSAGEVSFISEHIDKDIDEKNQDILLNLSSANVTVSPSEDGKLHLSYDNTENTHFEYVEKDDKITLTQKQKNTSVIGIITNTEKLNVVLSLPSGRDGKFNVNSASGDITISDLIINDEMNIYGVSGNVDMDSCKAEVLGTGTTSGDIKLRLVEASTIKAGTVSGEIRLQDIGDSIPLTLESVSGGIYVENAETKDLSVSTVSGDTELKNVSGLKANFSGTSGGVRLDKADFREIKFSTVSGDISGSVKGSSEDYTVFTETVSGRNSLSGHRGRGARTLDFSSTSGSFDISFEK
ncbi:MAG: DUF4097 family beta strand repeat-containing protein, partial [Oscillospiraceae bacterium]|nr:DUF4097 family beta strand repeat-containing protein [Oscillospiraceae bacterium]